MDEYKEKNAEQKREESQMVIRDPLLVWRLMALRSGCVPTLLPERIPQELKSYPLRPSKDTNHIKQLVEHAKKMRSWERKTAVKIFSLLLIGFLLLVGLSFAVTSKRGYGFNIPLFNLLSPRSESGVGVQAK